MAPEPRIRAMTIDDHDAVHALWLSTPSMGLNDVDDAREGITKVALVVGRNERGNGFWERLGFTDRPDLVYRNKALVDLRRIDT